DDRELGLLLNRSRGGSARSGRHGDRSRRRHAPLLLQHLGELRRLEHREARKISDDFLQISHRSLSYRFEPVEIAKGLTPPRPSWHRPSARERLSPPAR